MMLWTAPPPPWGRHPKTFTIAEMATLGLATQGIDALEANALPPYLNSVAVNDPALVRSDH